MNTAPCSTLSVQQPQPNELLIKSLERLLEQAKTGELRAMTYTAEWRGRLSSNGWWLDTDTDHLRVMGELIQLQAEFALNTQLGRSDSLIHEAGNSP